jgi:hypothetical protein
MRPSENYPILARGLVSPQSGEMKAGSEYLIGFDVGVDEGSLRCQGTSGW